MTYPIDAKSLMNGDHRGKHERVHSKKDPIIWKTHDYVIQSKRKGCFCCCGSNIHLETPLTDRVTFEKNVQAIIEFISGEKTSHKGLRISEKNLKALRKKALKATTIPERISEAFDKYEYDFLKSFLNCYNPQKFSKKYSSLKSKEQKLFKKIIGGNEVLKIIQDSHFKEMLEKLSKIAELINKVENIRISCNESIESFYDIIKTLEEKQIRDAFRYFQSDTMFGKKGFIFLNNKSLKFPNLSSIDDEGRTFLKWLRKKITLKITKEKELIDFILSCLSFNVFRVAHYSTLRETFPSFFETNLYSTRLKLDSKKPTRFFINKVDENTYEAVQEKNYSLITYLDDGSKQDCDIGNMKVCLKIKFNSKKEIISRKTYIKDIAFFDKADLQTQIDVLEKMDISKKISI